jgi:hypothetical protein
MTRGQLCHDFRGVRISGHRGNFAARAGLSIEAVNRNPIVLRLQHQTKRVRSALHRLFANDYFDAMASNVDHLLDREAVPQTSTSMPTSSARMLSSRSAATASSENPSVY